MDAVNDDHATATVTRGRTSRKPPYVLVQKVAEAAGSDVGAQQPSGTGIAVHYRLGMAPGASTHSAAGGIPGCAAAGSCTGSTCYC